MFCSNCGHELRTGAKFCDLCGQRADTAKDSQPEMEDQEPAVMQETETVQEFAQETELYVSDATENAPMSTTKKLIIGAIVVAVIVLGIVILSNAFSVEKKLMGTVWWAEPRFRNEAYDYSDSEWFQEDHPNSPAKGYWVDGNCESLLFCEYGTVRSISYSTPGYSGGAYMTSNKITADNVPLSFEWVSSTNNSGTWTLLNNNRLSVEDKTYQWSSNESENTWYMTATTLRIGTQYYKSAKPRIQNVADLPPYWCANCGEEGPFKNACPECESKEKTEE